MLEIGALEKQMAESRRLLLSWAELVSSGPVPVALPQHVREVNDLLTLLDEAPDWNRPELHYLIDRCDAMATRLAN